MATGDDGLICTGESMRCSVEEWSDAQCLSRDEILKLIEKLVLEFLQTVSRGDDPQLILVNRSDRNTVRDEKGTLHLGKTTTTKRLFGHRGVGIQRFTKIWQILGLIYQLVQENKVMTQREGYYCLVQHFKNQGEFNDTLQDVVALTGCTRASLGICASSSGGLAGLLLFKDPDGDWVDCSTGNAGKRIPGQIGGIHFKSMGARYILVVEKDAVFTYLCGQRIWDNLPCIIVTGCGYPPLSVRAVLKQLSDQFHLPVLGLFDYNPHGIRILLTYKYGSTRMGSETHAYAVNIHWLGVHHQDLFGDDGTLLVSPSALQSWTNSDKRVFASLKRSLSYQVGYSKLVLEASFTQGNHMFNRELELMETKKVKVEIEALNSSSFDGLERKLIHKILYRQYI